MLQLLLSTSLLQLRTGDETAALQDSPIKRTQSYFSVMLGHGSPAGR
jgi:hypothetical protein